MHKPLPAAFLTAALLAGAALAAWPASAQPATDPLAAAVRADMPSLLAIYRDLHAHPELSFQEMRSAAILAAEAKKLGFAVTTGVGKTGVVAVLKNGPGPVVLLRADMDALPVIEQTGLPLRQQGQGDRRRRGRDRRDARLRPRYPHDDMDRHRPPPRRDEGAMVRHAGDDRASRPRRSARAPRRCSTTASTPASPSPRSPSPSTIRRRCPAGTIGYADGYTMANVDSVDLLVKGVGGHGAYPQLAKDPIVLAARIVSALQTLVSREIDPLESGVVTVGSFHAGSKHNIIPDEARLQLTVRSYTPEVRKLLLDGIARIARGEAIAAGLPEDRLPVVTVQRQFHPGHAQHPAAHRHAHRRLRRALRRGARARRCRPQMGGEDFSRYSLADPAIQSLLFWVGGVPQAKWDAAGGDTTKLPSIHSPFWAPDPDLTIATATEAMTTAALTVLGKK